MSEPIGTPTIFPSFNARNLSAVDVARTFVPSNNFERLCGNNHSLIVGPRGSGKTTLLKMLQKKALDHWQHPNAVRIREGIGFTGVYIPTDVNWDKQIEALGDGQAATEISELLSVCAFTTHVLRSLALAFDESCPVPEEKAQLEHYCDSVASISKTWRTQTIAKSFRSLRHAMSERLADLHVLSQKLRFYGEAEAKSTVLDTDWLHLGFIESATYGLDVVNDYLDDPSKRWAFLFDELELSPAHVRRHLLDSLRSTDQRMLFKLSLVPYSDEMVQLEDTIKSATAGNDFAVVKLWYPHKEDAMDFCEQLWQATLNELGLENKSPEDVLGASVFKTNSKKWKEAKTAYTSKSKIGRRFKSLAEKDQTFRSFLTDKNIDPCNLDQLTGTQRPQTVRKVVSIVALRDSLLRSVDADGNASLQSKVTPDIYSGADSMFAVVEGNPRWFKGLVSELVKVHGVDRKVSARAQTAQVANVCSRFRALLRTIPCPPVVSRGTSRGILSVLDEIGKYFFQSQVDGPFNMDPVGSFTVHSRASDDLLESLGNAINAGAIIYLPRRDGNSNSEELLSSLRGKRFRLSYLLAINYKTLLRLGRDVSLQTILESDDGSTRSLFDDE